MNQKKINKYNAITIVCIMIFGLVVFVVMEHFKSSTNEGILLITLLVSGAISVFIPSHLAAKESICPSCKKYLTIKKNWIGKYCEHCGELVTEMNYESGKPQ